MKSYFPVICNSFEHTVYFSNMDLKNILVVRTDRIGDVILTLPMFPILRSRFPGAKITFLVRKYTRELVENQKEIDEVVSMEDFSSRKSFLSFLAEKKFDAVIVGFPRLYLAISFWRTKIPLRIGSGYRWYSFLFNERVFEHRKTAEYHELEYNLHLLKPLECELPSHCELSLQVDPMSEKRIQELFQANGINKDAEIVVLHPGSGGSARDWLAEKFGELGCMLMKEGIQIIITGAAGEEKLCNDVATSSATGMHNFCGYFSLRDLTALYNNVNVVVANSTGPIHIAAAVGTPVVGFYPPIRECSPERWGPYTEKKKIFVPDKDDCSFCKGSKCKGSECMNQISTSEAKHAVLALIQEYSKKAVTK